MVCTVHINKMYKAPLKMLGPLEERTLALTPSAGAAVAQAVTEQPPKSRKPRERNKSTHFKMCFQKPQGAIFAGNWKLDPAWTFDQSNKHPYHDRGRTVFTQI